MDWPSTPPCSPLQSRSFLFLFLLLKLTQFPPFVIFSQTRSHLALSLHFTKPFGKVVLEGPTPSPGAGYGPAGQLSWGRSGPLGHFLAVCLGFCAASEPVSPFLSLASCLEVVQGDKWRALGIVPALRWSPLRGFCSNLGFLMNIVTNKSILSFSLCLAPPRETWSLTGSRGWPGQRLSLSAKGLKLAGWSPQHPAEPPGTCQPSHQLLSLFLF